MPWKLDTGSQRLLILDWVFIAISFPFMISRLYIRIYKYGPLNLITTYRWSEFFAIFSWVVFLAYGAIDTPYYLLNLHYLNHPDEFAALKADKAAYMAKFAYAFKLQFVNGTIYRFPTYGVKAALLCFYLELSPKGQSYRIWVSIMATWALLAASITIHFVYRFTMCRPLSAFWTMTPQGNINSCIATTHYIIVNWVLNMITDIIVYAIPFFIIARIKNPAARKQIAVPVLMFGLGFVHVATAAFILAQQLLTVTKAKSPPLTSIVSTVFVRLQNFIAVIIVCIPYVRRCFVDLTDWLARGRKRVGRKFSSDVFSTIRRGSKTRKGSEPAVVEKKRGDLEGQTSEEQRKEGEVREVEEVTVTATQ